MNVYGRIWCRFVRYVGSFEGICNVTIWEFIFVKIISIHSGTLFPGVNLYEWLGKGQPGFLWTRLVNVRMIYSRVSPFEACFSRTWVKVVNIIYSSIFLRKFYLRWKKSCWAMKLLVRCLVYLLNLCSCKKTPFWQTPTSIAPYVHNNNFKYLSLN